MNCDDAGSLLNLTCKSVTEGLTFLQSPLTLAFDGSGLGAYVQELGNERYRISDNANTLFAAQTHGISTSAKRGDHLQRIAQSCQVNLSNDGELFSVCKAEELPYFLARFLDATARIGQACNEWLPKPATSLTRFDRQIGSVLKSHFQQDLHNYYAVPGASGHNLNFPFALQTGDQLRLIQTVPTSKGLPNWEKVYHAVGKLSDVRNANPELECLTIIEGSIDLQETQKAVIALSDCSHVIAFENPEQLLRALEA
jgi:hypothetical protein